MEQQELSRKLELHKKWLNDEAGGERADLDNADLRYADLDNADLKEANFDFSCLPLWCGGLSMHIDDRFAKQLLFHLLQNIQYSKHTSKELKAALLTDELIDLANQSHVVSEHCVKPITKE